MSKADKYTYRVAWSKDDREYVATVAEFPSLSWLASTPEEALGGMQELVKDVLVDMKRSHEEIPEPLSMRTFSGKFQIRIPPELHRRLVTEAAEEHVSLNRLITSRLV